MTKEGTVVTTESDVARRSVFTVAEGAVVSVEPTGVSIRSISVQVGAISPQVQIEPTPHVGAIIGASVHSGIVTVADNTATTIENENLRRRTKELEHEVKRLKDLNHLLIDTSRDLAYDNRILAMGLEDEWRRRDSGG